MAPSSPADERPLGAEPHGAEEASRVVREALGRSPFPSVAGLAFEISGLAWAFGAFAGFCALSHAFRGAASSAAAEGAGALSVTSWFDVARIVNEPPTAEAMLWIAVAAIPLAHVSSRLGAGLARGAAEAGPRPHRILRAWRRGGPVQLSALGLWILIAGMMASATVVLFTPLALLSGYATTHEVLAFPHVLLSGLGVAFAIAYGAGLGSVHELAYASLVRNERGVGSAVLHAWRLIRNRRVTSRQLSFAEVSTRVAVIAAAVAVGRHAAPWAGVVTLVVLGAIAGGVRAQAWSITYGRLGGLGRIKPSTEEDEPPSTTVDVAPSAPTS